MAVTPNIIADELGCTAPVDGSTEFRQWTQWIADARRILRKGDGGHAGLGDLDLLDQEDVDYVVRKAVSKHIKRPDDATTVQYTIDGDSSSRRYESSTGEVTISDAWWAMLQPDAAPDGAFSIRPSYAPDLPVLDCW